MNRNRLGSAILLCIALSAMAVMVGYAFLRAATRQTMSGKSEMMIALAREAAQSGLSHATEQILKDYNASSLELADHTGTITITQDATYPGALSASPPPPTFLDGPYRAPFVSLGRPNRILYTMHDGPTYYDDAGEENHLLMPMMLKREQGYSWWQEFDTRGVNGGNLIYDARGRFIEVNYHNVTRPDPATALPVATLRFTDLSTAGADPERADGLFLDENLRRLTSGSQRQRRALARYRLRYAVGVEDLSGHLLSNPRAKMNIDWKDAGNDYRNIPPWLDYAGHAWDNMMSMWAGSRATSLRLTHLLKGRGNAENTDRTATGMPATFPLMFRMLNNWYGYHEYDRNTATPNLGGRLYAFAGNATYPMVKATQAGGEVLTPTGQSLWAPYAHSQVGPQYSWFNQTFALGGVRVHNTRYDENYDGRYANPTENSIILNTLTTPFGRRVEFNPTGGKWYQGRIDLPWHINLLTAPPQVINDMLLGYLPPYLKTVHYYLRQYYKCTGSTTSGPIDPATGNPSFLSYTFDVNEDVSKQQSISEDYSRPGLDLFTERLGSGFSEFYAPSSYNAGDDSIVKPDYYQADPYTMVDPGDKTKSIPIPVDRRYPGPLMRGQSVNADEGDDDLGQHIDADSGYGQGMEVGWCTHTYNPLMYQGGGDRSAWDANPPKYLIITRIDPKQFTYRYSYFYDLTRALTTTLSYARATWVQYPNTVFDPRPGLATTGFTPYDLRNPTAYDTIEEIDRLFLRQLGENPDAPGTRNPLNPIICKRINTWPPGDYLGFSANALPVSNIIKTLVTGDMIAGGTGATSIERGKVMERVLNDFRMSFFGSSPMYRDFRPLDFDGDTKVMCSAYPINAAATPNEVKYRTARWASSVGGGKGPAPADDMFFSVTGCFFIGKSHFYRVWSRGEVYDSLLKKPVAQQTLESVLTVDPEAPLFPAAGRISQENRLLYKHWLYNSICSELPQQTR